MDGRTAVHWQLKQACTEGMASGEAREIEADVTQPNTGSPRPELSPTARILAQGRVLVIHEPQPGGVLVVAIVHGMRDPESWQA